MSFSPIYSIILQFSLSNLCVFSDIYSASFSFDYLLLFSALIRHPLVKSKIQKMFIYLCNFMCEVLNGAKEKLDSGHSNVL